MEKLTFESRPNNVLQYPVGRDIKSATNFASEAATVFKTIQPFEKAFMNVWTRGSSGAILGALFLSHFPNHVSSMIHVKKPGESAHCSTPHMSTNIPESARTVINIIIDDFIESGNTIKSIYREMEARFETVVDVLIAEHLANKDRFYFETKLGFIPEIILTSKRPTD